MTKNRGSRNGSFDVEIIEFILPSITSECASFSSVVVFNDNLVRYKTREYLRSFSKTSRCRDVFPV